MSIYHGWTPTVPLEIRIENLLEQIPPEHQARACLECYGQDDFEFERNLTAYVLFKKWQLPESGEQPHPAETAYELEKAMDADDPRTEWERNWDDYCAEAEETKRDLGEWARGR